MEMKIDTLMSSKPQTVESIIAPLKATINKLAMAKTERTKTMLKNDEKIIAIQAENLVHNEEIIRAERIKTKLEELLS